MGDGVAWRGTIIGILLGTTIAVLQGIIFMYYGDIFTLIPQWVTIEGIIPGNFIEWILLGLALSGGALIGDAVGSFIKRRIKIGRGKPAPFLDQLDFAVVALIFASWCDHTPDDNNFNLIFTIILHVAANTIAYLLE